MQLHELLTTDDAREWAKHFIDEVTAHPDIPTTVSIMEGWFANAMCTARDADARRRKTRTDSKLTPTQKALEEKHGNPEVFEKAVWAAHAQLFATTHEALLAIARYKQEWLVAGDAPPVDSKPEEA